MGMRNILLIVTPDDVMYHVKAFKRSVILRHHHQHSNLLKHFRITLPSGTSLHFPLCSHFPPSLSSHSSTLCFPMSYYSRTSSHQLNPHLPGRPSLPPPTPLHTRSTSTRPLSLARPTTPTLSPLRPPKTCVPSPGPPFPSPTSLPLQRNEATAWLGLQKNWGADFRVRLHCGQNWGKEGGGRGGPPVLHTTIQVLCRTPSQPDT